MKEEDFKVGESYKQSDLPSESNDEVTVRDYGTGYLYETAIHLKYATETNIWFIYDGYLEEAMLKCVYKD